MANESFDTRSEYNTSTYRFYPKVNGYYRVSARARSAEIAWASGVGFQIGIAKNGTVVAVGDWDTVSAAITSVKNSSVSDVVYLTTTDYIDIRVYQSNGISINTGSGSVYVYVTITNA
jgi:hypothetical protein